MNLAQHVSSVTIGEKSLVDLKNNRNNERMEVASTIFIDDMHLNVPYGRISPRGMPTIMNQAL